MEIIKITTDCIIKKIRISCPINTLLKKEINSSFEIVYPRRLPSSYCMIIDEDGHMKNLPINPIGSYFYESNLNLMPIVGDIIILKIEEGNLVGFSDLEALNLKKEIEKIMNLKNESKEEISSTATISKTKTDMPKKTPSVTKKIEYNNINFFGGLLGTSGKITYGGVYNENEVFPKFVNTVYMLDVNWINEIANTSYKHIQQKDFDNATLVAICLRLDIKSGKFRLYLIEPHGEYWTEYIDMDLVGKKCGRLGDKIDLYADRTLIMYGYSRAGKLYVTDIELTNFRRFLFS